MIFSFKFFCSYTLKVALHTFKTQDWKTWDKMSTSKLCEVIYIPIHLRDLMRIIKAVNKINFKNIFLEFNTLFIHLLFISNLEDGFGILKLTLRFQRRN